jgi:hypothetical protein
MKRDHFCFIPGVMIVTALAISATSSTPILAQAPAPEGLPSFEVASIRQNTSGDAGASMGVWNGSSSTRPV